MTCRRRPGDLRPDYCAMCGKRHRDKHHFSGGHAVTAENLPIYVQFADGTVIEGMKICNTKAMAFYHHHVCSSVERS